jgi:PAS domain S-box-containing protein
MSQGDRTGAATGPTPVPAAGARAVPPEGPDRTTISPPGRPAGAAADPPVLLLVSAPDLALVGRVFPLEAAELVVGRAEGSAIRLEDPGLSRSHARIGRDPSGRFVVEDLGSTNGTFLNGVAVRSAVLSEGDRLQVGVSTELLFGAHREVALAEVRLRQAISTAGAGTWEWFPASGALQIYGGLASAVGSPVDSTEPRAEDCWPRVHPEDRDTLRARLAGAAQGDGHLALEIRLLRRDGAVAWVAMTGEPFRDEAGRPVRLAGAVMDVTERRRAEVELRRQSLLFDSLADGVVVVGGDGTILDWNAGAERLLGWTKAEALGRRPGALLEPGGADRLDEALAECARGGQRRAEERRLRTRSGDDVPVEMTAVPLVSGGDGVVACVAVLRDLGEQRRLQARLRVAEQLAALGTLAAGVAHEINNPLSFVLSNLDYVAEQLEGPGRPGGAGNGEVAAALADSRTGAERIATIVRDLQAFSGGHHQQDGSPVDPNAALEFALRMAESRIRHRARLVKDLRPVPPVAGGEARVGQVFLNLLVNAAQAIQPGRAGEMVIRVASRHDAPSRRVVVEVTDDGVGIPPEVLPHVFEPFFTTRPTGGGSGLGLFVCHGIVSDLGGEIAVESEVGRGTTFRVSLPVSGDPAMSGWERPRVLVIDDEPLVGAGLRRYFHDRYEVVTEADPRRALQRIEAGERFVIALVDLQMPEMLGQEVLARLRDLDPALAGRSLAITGGPVAEAAATFPDGLRPVILPKPIDAVRLAALMDAALRR